jgi:hypothetical protein
LRRRDPEESGKVHADGRDDEEADNAEQECILDGCDAPVGSLHS